MGPEEKNALTERARSIETHGLSGVVGPWLSAVLSAATREANPALARLVREMFLSNDDARTYALRMTDSQRQWRTKARPIRKTDPTKGKGPARLEDVP